MKPETLVQQPSNPHSFSQDADRMRFAMSAAGIGIWEVDTKNNTVIWDDRCRELFGLAKDNVLPYEKAIQYIHPDDAESVSTQVQAALRGENGGHYDATYRTLGADDGQLRWVNFSGTAYFDDTRQLTRFGGVARDVTENVAAQKKTQKSEAFGKLLGNSVPAMIFYLDEEERYTSYNDTFMQWFGVNDTEVLGRTTREFIGEAAYTQIQPHLEKAYAGERAYFEMQAPTRLSPNRWLSIVYTPHKKEDGSVAGVIVHVTDITESKQAKAALEVSEKKYRTLFDSIDEGFLIIEFIYDAAGNAIDYRYLEANQSFERHTGLKNPVGKRQSEISPDSQDTWFSAYDSVVRTGKPIRLENYHAFTKRWYSAYAFPSGESDKHRVAVLFNDITSRKTAEQELKENKDLLQTVFDTAPNSISVMQTIYNDEGSVEDFTLLMLNAFTLNVVGDVDYKGKRYSDVFPTVKENGVLERFKEVAATGNSATFERWYAGEGMRHWFRFTAVKQDGLLVVTTEDITERKNAEQFLKASKEKLQNLIRQVPTPICIYEGPQFIVSVANEQMLQFWGKTAEEVMGKPIFKSVPEAAGQGYEEMLTNALKTGKPFSAKELPVTLFRDGSLQTVYINFAYEPLREPDSSVSGIIVTATDVTNETKAKKTLEENEITLQIQVAERTRDLADANATLQKTNKELLRSNQNLEEFAHAASHDLKEPIRKIYFFTTQLRDQLHAKLGEAEMRNFQRIENATSRMGDLIDDLLIYSHVSQRPIEKDTVSLNEKVRRVLEDLELDVQETKAVIRVGTLPNVQGYRRQLQQLFQNLISNALKYTTPGVAPQIEITACNAQEKSKPYHCVSVADNGIGFAQEYADKIFRMFTRLHGKNEYSGTGVGLSIVKKVVENHEGFIEVESAPGKGATFKIYLPA